MKAPDVGVRGDDRSSYPRDSKSPPRGGQRRPDPGSLRVDQPLRNQGLDVLAPGRIEPVATEDEVGAVAPRPIAGLLDVVERAVRLVQPERLERPAAVAGQRPDQV